MERSSEQFKENYINLFLVQKHHNVNYGMYAYGLTMFSYHNRSNEIDYNPIKNFSGKEWNNELHRRINWGATDLDNIDDVETYSAKFDIETSLIDTNEYLIKRAIELNRPDWSLFYLIGNIQGRLNYNGTIVKEYEIFTKEDFIRCLSYLSIHFFNKYKIDLEYLFNYFDERGLKLKIEIHNNEFSIYLY